MFAKFPLLMKKPERQSAISLGSSTNVFAGAGKRAVGMHRNILAVVDLADFVE